MAITHTVEKMYKNGIPYKEWTEHPEGGTSFKFGNYSCAAKDSRLPEWAVLKSGFRSNGKEMAAAGTIVTDRVQYTSCRQPSLTEFILRKQDVGERKGVICVYDALTNGLIGYLGSTTSNYRHALTSKVIILELIGGGGGATGGTAFDNGGGGGAGGYLCCLIDFVTCKEYKIIIGKGGAGVDKHGTPENGGDTTLINNETGETIAIAYGGKGATGHTGGAGGSFWAKEGLIHFGHNGGKGADEEQGQTYSSIVVTGILPETVTEPMRRYINSVSSGGQNSGGAGGSAVGKSQLIWGDQVYIWHIGTGGAGGTKAAGQNSLWAGGGGGGGYNIGGNRGGDGGKGYFVANY